MARAATFPEVNPFAAGISSLGEYRRVVLRHVGFGLGALAAVGTTGAVVTVAAAWMVATALSTHPAFDARVPVALQTTLPVSTQRARVDTARLAAAYASALAREAEALRVVAAASAPAEAAPLPADPVIERAERVPLPPPVPSEAPRRQAKHEVARLSAVRVAPQVAVAAPPPSEPILPKLLAPQQAHNNPISLPGPGHHTAVYDIEAHTVYLPNGERLEAHSGIGHRMDDPHYAGEKNRGPTPPNVYDLAMREQPFHGVRAIRLNPVDDGKMFGRDGILAHTYMLGPTGQSFGCVSFKDYPAFLRAFQKGEIDRIVVVPHRGHTASPVASGPRKPAGRYALND
jgi:hypothetical protein